MENRNKASCPENEDVAAYLFNKQQEMAQSAKGISENMDMTLSMAYSNICNCNTPIKTLRDLSQIKGVGKCILKQMQGFFETDLDPSEKEDLIKEGNLGNKNKGPKHYMPQKNSVAYALLITLFRGIENGYEFMRKKDLIDAAEASRLSREAIRPVKGKGKAGSFGSSPRDWYTGWSCMKTLLTRGLVVKSSSPAIYMLTEEGKDVARECLSRSGTVDQNKSSVALEGCLDLGKRDTLQVDIQGDVPDLECLASVSVEDTLPTSVKTLNRSIDVPPECLDKSLRLGFSRQQIIPDFTEVSKTSQKKELSSIWPAVLCRLREDEVFGSITLPHSKRDVNSAAVFSYQHKDGQAGLHADENIQPREIAASSNQMSSLHDFGRSSCTLKAASSNQMSSLHVFGRSSRTLKAASSNQMSSLLHDFGRSSCTLKAASSNQMSSLHDFGRSSRTLKFGRSSRTLKFGRSSRTLKFGRSSCTLKAASSNQMSSLLHDFGWSSTLKACSSTDYAVNKLSRGQGYKPNTLPMPPLAFGEKFGDLYEVILILDNREQFATKGPRYMKIIEKIRSQFQIQIDIRRLPVGDGVWIARHKYLRSEYVLDFIVERKNVDDLRQSIRDNRYRDQKMRLARCGLKKMIYLVEGDPNSSEAAESIKKACFTTEILEEFDLHITSGLADTLKKYGHLTQSINQYYKYLDEQNCNAFFPSYDGFIKKCEELDKMTVSDVFALQLVQVPQVTEDIALAVLDMYPTLVSLARAYSLLDDNVCAQEEMLWRQSKNLVNNSASKNIFQLVWGG